MVAVRNDERCDWASFYVMHRRVLVQYAVHRTGSVSDGMDLVHDVLLRLIAQGVQPTQPRAFVLRCLRNLALDRRRARRPAADSNLEFESPPIAAPRAEQDEEHARLRAAVQRLPEAQRETIVLKVFGEMTFEEVAAVLEKPLGTVASLYARGLQSLRQDVLSEHADERA